MRTACSVRVRGVVQGVGFRPFVFRLARAHTLAGWVLNDDEGVQIHVEGADEALKTFLRDLREQSPPAARITAIDVSGDEASDVADFTIRESRRSHRPTARIAPDLPVCDACLAELVDQRDRRFGYPYINCTNCGPRYTVITDLPYDRGNTTMRAWPLDAPCAEEFHDPGNRRFHAQPVACPACGPRYRLMAASETISGSSASIRRAIQLLADGAIVAVKGLGGYHLACDARNARSVTTLRERKYRKEKAFAVMVGDVEVARSLVELSAEAQAALESVARPIVLAPARVELPGVAPDHDELGVMLPYTPLHHLLFAGGAPAVLVMTSANRSSEPIAYGDEDALRRLTGMADAFLVGERPIARRVDDSVVRANGAAPLILRRARGYAPGAVAAIPTERPILAVGGDLKNAITLVVDGQAFVSQHIGDLDQEPCRRAFVETIDDLIRMYGVDRRELLVVHDAHPEYASTVAALEMPAMERRAVQHHRAHVASVLAELEAWDQRVLGVAFDGTGYGDDGTIWGGELFVGSVSGGFARVAHLRPALLPGGDAAAKHPVQAAAGFLAGVDGLPDLCAPPFGFQRRFVDARRLIERGVRTFATTSMGRLFDAAAALAGFTRTATFEGQAAMWLEQLARRGGDEGAEPYEMPFEDGQLDFRPLLASVIRDRIGGRAPAGIALAFHRGIARALVEAVTRLCGSHRLDTVVLSGGVFQNRLLLQEVRLGLANGGVQLWMNRRVPPNDGGLSLGQAAAGAVSTGTGRA
jgi:hydrogenase maturation protein HypF